MYHANTLVKSGLAECALALGFERMAPGSLKSNWEDRQSPLVILHGANEKAENELSTGENFGPGSARMFANAAQEHMDKYGSTIEHLAKIG